MSTSTVPREDPAIVAPPEPKGNPVVDSDEEGEPPVEREEQDSPPAIRRRSSRISAGASMAPAERFRSISSSLTPLRDDDTHNLNHFQQVLVHEPNQLPDYLLDSRGRGPQLIFCGKKPGHDAVEEGHHWAASGLRVDGVPKKGMNCFYKLLEKTGFTDIEHHYSEDLTFPDRYSIGLTTAVRDPLLKSPTVLDISSALNELFEKVFQLRPLVVCFKGLTDLTDAVVHRLNECGRDGNPDYVNIRRTGADGSWIPFKFEHDDGSKTYLFSIVSPSNQASILLPKRVAELSPLKLAIDKMREGTFVDPPNLQIQAVNLAPLRRAMAARAARAAAPSPSPAPPPRKRSVSPSMDDAQPTPKKSRPSAVEPENAVGGPSRLRDQELGLDPSIEDEEPAARMEDAREAEKLALEAERDELLRRSREREAAIANVEERNGSLQTEVASLEERLAEKEREVVGRREEIDPKDREVEDLKREKQVLEDEKAALLVAAAVAQPPPQPSINDELDALGLSQAQTDTLRSNIEHHHRSLEDHQRRIKRIAEAQASLRVVEGGNNELLIRLVQKELKDAIEESLAQ